MKTQKLVLKKIEISTLSNLEMQAVNGGAVSYPGNSTVGDCGTPTPARTSIDAGCIGSGTDGCLSGTAPASCRHC